MVRQPALRPPGFDRKMQCHAGAAGAGGYGYSLNQPHFNNGYNDGSGSAGIPPQFGSYPPVAGGVDGGGGDREHNSLHDEFAYKKEEESDDPAVAAADVTAHKRIKMSSPDGADGVEAKSENKLEDFGKRDRSSLAVAVKEEDSGQAAEEAGVASRGDHIESRSTDNIRDDKSGEQENISVVQRVVNNNGGLMDIPELPEIPELKFNEEGDGHRRKREHQQRPGDEGGEQFQREGPMVSGEMRSLPSAMSPSSSLQSGRSRQEEEMSQNMTTG